MVEAHSSCDENVGALAKLVGVTGHWASCPIGFYVETLISNHMIFCPSFARLHFVSFWDIGMKPSQVALEWFNAFENENIFLSSKHFRFWWIFCAASVRDVNSRIMVREFSTYKKNLKIPTSIFPYELGTHAAIHLDSKNGRYVLNLRRLIKRENRKRTTKI